MTNTCRICGQPVAEWATATILGRHPIRYDRCQSCGLVQTEAPYWLDEAYATAITTSDIGLVGRNLAQAGVTEAVILGLCDPKQHFLDYGGGYGLFVRLMRDRGFQFFRQDPFCQNLFAAQFDAPVEPARPYELVTAFEVLEHLTDPVPVLDQLLQTGRSVLCSTRLLPSPAPKPGSWWYYGLEHGQHVALYTRSALNAIAHRLGVRVASDNRSLHLFTRQPVSETWFRALRVAGRFAPALTRLLLGWRLPVRTLLPTDFEQLTGLRLG